MAVSMRKHYFTDDVQMGIVCPVAQAAVSAWFPMKQNDTSRMNASIDAILAGMPEGGATRGRPLHSLNTSGSML